METLPLRNECSSITTVSGDTVPFPKPRNLRYGIPNPKQE